MTSRSVASSDAKTAASSMMAADSRRLPRVRFCDDKTATRRPEAGASRRMTLLWLSARLTRSATRRRNGHSFTVLLVALKSRMMLTSSTSPFFFSLFRRRRYSSAAENDDWRMRVGPIWSMTASITCDTCMRRVRVTWSGRLRRSSRRNFSRPKAPSGGGGHNSFICRCL